MDDEMNPQFIVVEVMDQHERSATDFVGAPPEIGIDLTPGKTHQVVCNDTLDTDLLFLSHALAEPFRPLNQKPIEGFRERTGKFQLSHGVRA